MSRTWPWGSGYRFTMLIVPALPSPLAFCLLLFIFFFFFPFFLKRTTYFLTTPEQQDIFD